VTSPRVNVFKSHPSHHYCLNGVVFSFSRELVFQLSFSKRKKKKSREFKEDYGHTPLSGYELDGIGKEGPEVVYIGTGQYGSLPITEEAKDLLRTYSAVIAPTPEVISALADEKRHYFAILHVTC
jgi:hypothetical protein